MSKLKKSWNGVHFLSKTQHPENIKETDTFK